jgi:hypothetical protein
VITCEDADVDCFILDEEGQCYKDERDKICPMMGLSTNLVKLQMLRCCYYFFFCFRATKF